MLSVPFPAPACQCAPSRPGSSPCLCARARERQVPGKQSRILLACYHPCDDHQLAHANPVVRQCGGLLRPTNETEAAETNLNTYRLSYSVVLHSISLQQEGKPGKIHKAGKSGKGARHHACRGQQGEAAWGDRQRTWCLAAVNTVYSGSGIGRGQASRQRQEGMQVCARHQRRHQQRLANNHIQLVQVVLQALLRLLALTLLLPLLLPLDALWSRP